MKVKVLSVCCAVLLVLCAVLSAVAFIGDPAEPASDSETSALPATTSSDNIQFKLSLLHLLYESKDIVMTLPFTSTQVSQTALLKAFTDTATAAADANAYIDRYSDRTLASAYETMDEVLYKYDKLLKKYNISSSSSYSKDYDKLATCFSSLKNTATELMSRTRTLINIAKSDDYDDYYLNYAEQLSTLTDSVLSHCNYITNAYESILNSISDDYELITETDISIAK